MKKFFKVALALMMMVGFIQPVTVHAQPSLSISASSSQAYVGETVSVTVSVAGAGRVKITGAVTSDDWFEDSSKTYEVTANAPGVVTIDAKGVVADTTTEETTEVSGSVSIAFVDKPAPKPEPQPEPKPDPKPEPQPEPQPKPEEKPEKSTDARLYSLYVDKGELSPSFSADTYDYTVNLTDEQEIKITAYGYHDKATVKGDGVKPLRVGNNSFTITVTAEDGKTRNDYNVNVNVKETPKANFTIDGVEYGVVSEGVVASIPKGFKETTLQIQDAVVTACKKDGITLVMLQDEHGNTGYYIYNAKTQKIECEFEPVRLGSKELYVIDTEETAKDIRGMSLMMVKTKTNDELLGYGFDDNQGFEDYSVFHLKNSKNENGYYIYNQEEDKIEAYPDDEALDSEAIKTYIEDNMTDGLSMWVYVLIGAVVIAAIGGGIYVYTKKKGPKKPKGPKKTSRSKETSEDDEEVLDDQEETGKRKVTDDTFFKEIPEIDDEEKMSLEIENALNDMKQADFEKTIVASNESVEKVEDKEDDEWLDASMMDTIFGDEDK